MTNKISVSDEGVRRGRPKDSFTMGKKTLRRSMVFEEEQLMKIRFISKHTEVSIQDTLYQLLAVGIQKFEDVHGPIELSVKKSGSIFG